MLPLLTDGPARADLLLGAMGVVLLVGLAVGVLSGFSVRLGVAVASLLAGVGILDGLLVHPPVE